MIIDFHCSAIAVRRPAHARARLAPSPVTCLRLMVPLRQQHGAAASHARARLTPPVTRASVHSSQAEGVDTWKSTAREEPPRLRASGLQIVASLPDTSYETLCRSLAATLALGKPTDRTEACPDDEWAPAAAGLPICLGAGAARSAMMRLERSIASESALRRASSSASPLEANHTARRRIAAKKCKRTPASRANAIIRICSVPAPGATLHLLRCHRDSYSVSTKIQFSYRRLIKTN